MTTRCQCHDMIPLSPTEGQTKDSAACQIELLRYLDHGHFLKNLC